MGFFCSVNDLEKQQETIYKGPEDFLTLIVLVIRSVL